MLSANICKYLRQTSSQWITSTVILRMFTVKSEALLIIKYK